MRYYYNREEESIFYFALYMGKWVVPNTMEVKKSYTIGFFGLFLNIVYWGIEAFEHGLANLGNHFLAIPLEHLIILFQIPIFMLVGYSISRLETEIIQRKSAEESLQIAHDDLEKRLKENNA